MYKQALRPLEVAIVELIGEGIGGEFPPKTSKTAEGKTHVVVCLRVYDAVVGDAWPEDGAVRAVKCLFTRIREGQFPIDEKR